jgi:hypothetical protein
MNWINPPKGVFKGNNFMTPEVLGYCKVPGGYVELSKGRGISRELIFGVTFRDGKGEDHDKRGKLFWSRGAAESYIEAGAPGAVEGVFHGA